MKETISSDKYPVLLLIFALLAGCALRCWNINQSFWWDEIWSTLPYAKAHSVWHIFSSLGYYFNNHLLYSLLARGSMKFFGESELTARLPALIMGLFAIVAVFQFGKRFLGASCAGLAALLLALAPFHIDHSSEARGYSGLALFSILASFYFLEGLKTNGRRSWILYICSTVLGFCSHVFMVAVSMAQIFSSLLLMMGAGWFPAQVHTTSKAVRHAVIALFCAGVITLLIYSPVLTVFFGNLGKVRLVSINRLPYLMSLADSFLFPGIKSALGSIAYGTLFCLGMYYTLKKDTLLFIYFLVLFFLPVSIYLLINPMFVLERYFIFALPFFLLVFSVAIAELAERVHGFYQTGVMLALIGIMAYLQLPLITVTLHRDRQNYREAVRYVKAEGGTEGDALVFSIGYAGEHFRYYSSGLNIATPQTMSELLEMSQGKKHVWCLITAWLPELRPWYEDREVYAERPGQVEIYDYVKAQFTLKKHFSSKYGVDIYYGELQVSETGGVTL